jgi:hypothetical protein
MVTKPGGDLDVSGVHHGQTIDMTGKTAIVSMACT